MVTSHHGAESSIPTIYEVQFYVSTDTAFPETGFPETGFDCTVITNVTISSTPYSLVSTFNVTSLSEVPIKLVAGYDMVTTGIQCDLVNINLGILYGTFVVRFSLNTSDFILDNSGILTSTPLGLTLSEDSSTKIQTYTPAGGVTSAVYLTDLNPYNDPTKTTFTEVEKYAYKSDGHTIGGSGVNGSYNIWRTDIPIYDTIAKKPVYTTNIYKKSLQRGEIYGFALVGFDEYMRPSFAKFIDDIKIPGYNEMIS